MCYVVAAILTVIFFGRVVNIVINKKLCYKCHLVYFVTGFYMLILEG